MENLKKKTLWMAAAIMMICSTMMSLTSCSDSDDNSDATAQEMQKREALKKNVVGGWIDPVMYNFLDYMDIYNIKNDGTCEVYELSEGDVDLNEEGVQAGDIVKVDTYSGAWSVLTCDKSVLATMFDMNQMITNSEVLGALEIKVSPVVDENDQYAKALYEQMGKPEQVDTILVTKTAETGDTLLLELGDLTYMKGLQECGTIGTLNELLFSANTKNSTRATSSEIEAKIKEITVNFDGTKNSFKSLAGEKTTHNDWMGTIYKGLNPRVCDISMAGVHDGFTGYMSAWHPMSLWTKTQTKKIEDMWACGVRYFDARLRVDGDHLALYHTFSLSITFKEVLTKITDLLKAHPGEMAIMIINFDDGNNPKMVYDEMQQFKDYLVTNAKPDIRLNECRGKILAITRYSVSADNEYAVGPTAHGWSDNTQGTTGSLKFKSGATCPLYIQDFYHYKNSWFSSQKDTKKNAITNGFKEARKTASTSQCTWILNHESAYCFGLTGAISEFIDMNYAENANMMNPHVEEQITSNMGYKTGIVVMDFAGENSMFDGAKCFGYSPKGVFVPRYLVMNNMAMVKKHSISLDEGDEIK